VSITATPVATVAVTPSSIEGAVLLAYENYWMVYSEALYNLDSTRLPEVMTGPRLDRALSEIQNLKRDGRAVRIAVENTPIVVSVNGDTAVVLDKYKNQSFFVNPTTKQPITQPGTSETIQDSVTLTRVGTSWKVLDAVREVGTQ
jgi:hypothetical protein